MKIIQLICSHCGAQFERPEKQYKYQKKVSGDNYKPFCSLLCQADSKKHKIKTTCANCGETVFKRIVDFNKNTNNFCTHTCSAQFNNKERKKNGFSLKGKQKEAKCIICNKIGFLAINASVKTFLCINCKPPKIRKQNKQRESRIHDVNCIICNIKFFTPSGKGKYCKTCIKQVRSDLGKRIGKLSAAKQVRRSKNEIYFSELCEKQFKTITTNDGYFQSKYGNWDADIIIHDHKIAVLWNGIWHFKQVRKSHSVKQVQARDKIKIDVIKQNGYIPYVVIDMGKYNKKFVEEQFKKFNEFITDGNR